MLSSDPVFVPITRPQPAFELAEEARTAIMAGRFTEAMALLSQAMQVWDPQQAPKGPDGLPELFWPELWRGSLLTLDCFPMHLFRASPLASLPLCSLTP